MPGIKKMAPCKPNPGKVRNRIWQSMRIMRRFTIPDLCRTAGAKESNVRKFIGRLKAHGYVAKFGVHISGRSGSYQGWRLVKDIGPDHPIRCGRCGNPLGYPCQPEGEDRGTDGAF